MAGAGLEPWVAEAIRQRATWFADELRQCGDGGTPVPNLDWTVADLGRHVAALPALWEAQHSYGADFERPDDVAAFSAEARAHIDESEPAELAELVVSEFDRYLAELAADDGDRWLYGNRCMVSDLCGLAVNELVLHGRDIAAVTGADPPSFERREANVAVDAIMTTTPFFVDADKARRQPDGVYHLRFRAGHDYSWVKDGGGLHITRGRPDRADAHLNADPAVFLMLSLERMSRLRAALTGGMVVYGRKPWRFLGLPTMLVDGV